MFDGKILSGLTGTHMRRIARANNSFAEAEPEPLTLANLTTKSLVTEMRLIGAFTRPPASHACGNPAPHSSFRAETCACPRHRSGSARRRGRNADRRPRP